MKELILTIVCICGLLYISFISGEKSKEREIRDRAKDINKECYTNEDIEKIIFNASQL